MEKLWKHRIFLNDEGIIECEWNEQLTWREYVDVLEITHRLASDLVAEGKPVKIIVNFTNLTTFDSEERFASIAKRGLGDIPYEKIAGYGIKPEHQPILDVIKDEVQGNPGQIRDFSDRASALLWLSADAA
jgi:hypothetical protein